MNRFEERPINKRFTYVVEWRTIAKLPTLEINQDGEVRTARTGKIRATNDGRNHRLRVMEDGWRVSYSIRDLRNEAFPELEPM